ncbi:inositol polyphosphate 4-phosphatase type II isoform X5 [Mesoplodon densirostris]|uniref:inositol polyphosphate 4-phosphatase type II isoform X5 n=1 Tax=Mesoplodon densirostris TaxID=48708 RepID=UPI0028DBDCB1|nr:inositol polyphosphate 4-phosphatase type II isoform X5 [Mesoplodon densirostris]
MEIKEEGASEEGQNFLPTPQANDTGEFQFTSIQKTPNEPQLEFILACKDLVAPVRDRKLNTLVQISVIHPAEQGLTRYSSTEIVEGTRDPLFLTGVTFPSEYPIYEETKIKLTVYDVKDKSYDTVRTSVLPEHKDPPPEVGRSFLGYASFKVGDLLKSKEQVLTLSLRTSDGGKVVGTIQVSVVKMGEIEDGEADHITTDVQGQKCALVCECTAPESVSRKDNLPFLNAVLKNPVCKLYRFPTSDNKWMRIREQMSESILSFHIPKELISLQIKEDLCRNQELKELGELSPHWDNLRKNVLTHCDQMVNMYQDILTELSKETGSSFKSSSSKGEKTLEFVPINLHLQRMHVHSPHLKDALYDVITVGAPAAHFQGFKNGGLRKLLHRFETERRNTGYQFIYYSPENTAKAKEVLSNINQLQPLIATHADLLLNSASQHSPDSLKNSLKMLSEKTELFVHAFKDQLVRSALLALYTARPGGVLKKPPSPKNSTEESSSQDPPPPMRRQDSIPHHSDYDEEEWDRVWAHVGKSLNCIIAMVDKLIERDGSGEGDDGSDKDGEKGHSLGDSVITHPHDISHFQEQNDLKGLLENLHQNIQAKKRKNVEIMWLAATICRKLNGIRFTCCKSAKDRTSMSVTLEQCSILRDEHQLHKDFFIRALDCMRSRQTQGALNESDDPETGCLTDNKPTSRHFYPVALLLVSSHLLVVWLILSLALLLAKYQ